MRARRRRREEGGVSGGIGAMEREKKECVCVSRGEEEELAIEVQVVGKWARELKEGWRGGKERERERGGEGRGEERRMGGGRCS